MHTFSHAEIHAGIHATRTAEAAAWRRARTAAPFSRASLPRTPTCAPPPCATGSARR